MANRGLRSRSVLLALAFVLLGACAGNRVVPLMPTPVLFSELDVGPLDHIPPKERWKPRRVYYATTRQRLPSLQRIDYTNDEANEVSVGLALIGFGGPSVTWSDLNTWSRVAERPETVDLSIAGLVEAGSFVPHAGEGARDVVGAAAWLMADLNAAIETARDRDLLIYVHGAKVDFYNACAFAAQLDHFMGRDMTSLAFSWPTRQNILAYGSGADVKRAYRSAEALRALVELLARDSIARRIHIVAWSAGGRVVTSALASLRARHPEATPEALLERYRLGTVYLAAADVPHEEFIEALPALDDVARRVVVTASSNDGALRAASIVMGGGARIGQVNRDLTDEQLDTVLAAERLQVVNVSQGSDSRGFDITGHRYWLEHPWASSDVILSIRSDLEPAERALAPTDLPILWTIPADYPERLRASVTRPDLQIRRP